MPEPHDPISALRLPEGWSAVERVEDAVDADGLRLHRVGLSSRSPAGEAVGAAASWESSPADRAAFELLERVVLLEASAGAPLAFTTRSRDGAPALERPAEQVFPVSPRPELWAYARSSGVALHRSWDEACVRAAEELAERDRVLRAWLGELRPEPVRFDVEASPFGMTRSYEWRAWEFPEPRADGGLAGDLRVVGIYGFPRAPSAPLVFGYGARAALADALAAATREAAQLLAFLWGEPATDALPEPAPTPMFHLETYQVRERHALLRHWLEEGHGRHARPSSAPPTRPGAMSFVDLTPAWLGGGLHVAKAISDDAVQLTFGRAPGMSHLPGDLIVHPIP